MKVTHSKRRNSNVEESNVVTIHLTDSEFSEFLEENPTIASKIDPALSEEETTSSDDEDNDDDDDDDDNDNEDLN